MPTDTSVTTAVAKAASLYSHINERLALQGSPQADIHYHLGFEYATHALAGKLDGLGVDATWNLLDVCCGWGVATRYLAQRFGCQITGVDLTSPSIEFARQVQLGEKEKTLIHYVNLNALDLPQHDATHDLIWSQDGFCHIPDRPKLLSGLFRVLKPGGYLVFTDWLQGSLITESEKEAFYGAWSFPDLETLASYTKKLKAAGFDLVSQEEVGREYALAGESSAIANNAPSFIQRTAAKETRDIQKSIDLFGHASHLEQLEREKMDLYFAQGKLELGRFVCLKPLI